MKKLAIIAATLFAGFGAQAQTADDPVLMQINGNPITRSEFEYSYNKNNAEGVLDKKGVKDYVDLFVNFKLKVEAAKDAGYDTLTAVRRELESYKEQMVLPTLVDSDFIERTARETYDNTAKRFDGQDLLTASHILVVMRQDATAEQQAAAKARVDSIYQELLNGADFAELARKHSDDKGSAARGGQLPQFGKGMMVPKFEAAAYALKAGEMSKPIESDFGWHIIKLHERHAFEPYEYHHDNIIKFLEQRGIKEASANALIDSVAKQEGVEKSAVIDRYYQELMAQDAESRYLAQEYYDGTLMYEISKNQIWDPAAKDEAGLAAYFKANEKKYAWDAPRYRGIVIHAKDKATLAKAKKLLKNVPEDDWAKTLVAALNNDSVKLVRVERGIYKQGDNKAVDALVFKSVKDYAGMKDYPVTDVYGKKLKKPETYADVRGQVATDYTNERENRWVEELRRRYSFTVNEAVLETVNQH
ncbi:MAG: peptidylprolyl isomerase [Prevotellaceae bacterium]|nr:peptidylprolyl isomerase [Prevotellaceae bacterium]